MKSLRFRAPGSGASLDDLLAMAWPAATSRQRAQLLRAGTLRVGGRTETRPTAIVAGGLLVTGSVPMGESHPTRSSVNIIQQENDFVVVDKPKGWPSHAATPDGPDARSLVAATLDLPIESLWPVHRLDADVSGAWLIALTKEAAARLYQAFTGAQVQKEYRALAPAPPWRSGSFQASIDEKKAETRFHIVATRGPVAELALTPVTGRTHQLRRHLAGAHCPLLGDALYGGVMIPGGLRLYSRRIHIEEEGIDAQVEPPESFLPLPDGWTLTPRIRDPVEISVSRATLVALDRGHPWILTDTETSDVGGHPPGTRAKVRSADGKTAGICLLEGPGRIAARLWSPPGMDPDRPDVEQRVRGALERRAKLLRCVSLPDETQVTNAIRLIHAEADGLPGLAVDLLADQLRCLVLGRCCEAFLGRVVSCLVDELASILPGDPKDLPVVQVTHLLDRPRGEYLSVLPLRGAPRPDPFLVRERGLLFEADNGLSRPMRSRPGVGLYLDQRDNRQRISKLIRAQGGGRWLNLFCHTGAFSVAALAAGADHVTSVDLSRPYLETLRRNLERNDLDLERHEAIRKDSRRYVDGLARREKDIRFDGIILDPPTAAARGRQFWSQRKELGELIGLCLARLTRGGTLLVSRNDHGAREPLRRLIEKSARNGRIRLDEIKEAPPGSDFPRLRGFPEGDAFEGAIVRRV